MERRTTRTRSSLVRRQLGRRLRELRDRAGKTIADVDEASLASPSKLWRIESGRAAVKVADVRGLCWLYHADEATTDTLARLAAASTDQGWWEDFTQVVPDWLGLYLDLEAEADEICLYDPELVHGLLQTPDYARAVIRLGAQAGDEGVARALELRLARQRNVLERSRPARIRAVLGAGALLRPVGGKDVVDRQLRHLHDLSRQDHVDLRVLPFDVGEHLAMNGAFTLMSFPEPDDPPVTYLESRVGGQYLDQPQFVDIYRGVFHDVHGRSVPLEDYQP